MPKTTKSSINILIRECPACKNVVPWAKRKLLIAQTHIKCPKCKTKLIINPRDRMINTFFLAILISVADVMLFEESSSLRSISFFMIMVFLDIPKFLNVLFSLSEMEKHKMRTFSS